MKSSIGLPAIPPAALIFLTAALTATSFHVPSIESVPVRSCVHPMRIAFLACANTAGTQSPLTARAPPTWTVVRMILRREGSAAWLCIGDPRDRFESRLTGHREGIGD